MRCVLERVVTRTSFEEGQMVEIARQLECGHQEREEEEDDYSSDEEDSDEDEDSSNEDDSNEDDHRVKVELEGNSRISTTFTASTTHAAAGDSPHEIGPVSEYVDEYNEVYDICGDLSGESKC